MVLSTAEEDHPADRRDDNTRPLDFTLAIRNKDRQVFLNWLGFKWDDVSGVVG